MDPTSQLDDAQRYAAKLRAPFAVLGIRTDGDARSRASPTCRATNAAQAPADRVAERAVREIERYLDDPEFASPFRSRPAARRSSAACGTRSRAIPSAESRTYGEIARTVRSAPRAVGQACGANRIALIIPCHRVVGSRGVARRLHGRRGG